MSLFSEDEISAKSNLLKEICSPIPQSISSLESCMYPSKQFPSQSEFDSGYSHDSSLIFAIGEKLHALTSVQPSIHSGPK